MPNKKVSKQKKKQPPTRAGIASALRGLARSRKRLSLVVFAVLFGAVGTYYIFSSSAATPLLTGADGEFTPLSPTRILDTRSGVGGIKVPVGQTPVSVQIAGQGGIPSTGVKTVVMNVTVVGQSANSFLTVWPSGLARPNISNINYSAGKVISNQATVRIGSDGKVLLASGSGTTNVVLDVAGYYANTSGTPGLRFYQSHFNRVVDTRTGIGGITGAVGTTPVTVQAITADIAKAPYLAQLSQVKAVVLNVTVVSPTAGGYVTLWPAGETRPGASSVNFAAGQTIANQVTVKVNAEGKIQLVNYSGSAHVLIDIAGYYAEGAFKGSNDQYGRFVAINPTRILDTRNKIGTYVSRLCNPTPYTDPTTTMIEAPTCNYGSIKPFSIQFGYKYKANVPDGSLPFSSVMNFTVTQPTASGYIRFNTDYGTNQHSNINFAAGQTIANAVTPNRVSGTAPADGDNLATKIIINNGAKAHVIADLFGYFIK